VLETALHLGPQLIGARRLLGLAQAGMGRYADALESWDRWARATPRRPEEDARSTEVERLRAAVAIVLDALRGRHV
jgi:cytochrome c-type biogenesis protein CcmH/NrfG